MKKLLALLIIAVLLTGCAKQESALSESAPPPLRSKPVKCRPPLPELQLLNPPPTTAEM